MGILKRGTEACSLGTAVPSGGKNKGYTQRRERREGAGGKGREELERGTGIRRGGGGGGGRGGS